MQNKKQSGRDKNPYIGQEEGMAQGRVDAQSAASQNMNLNNQNPYYINMNNNNINRNSGLMGQMNPPVNNPSLFDSFDTTNFLKGAAIGAIGAYLLTNEDAQKTIFKTVAKGTEMFQAGIEEMKERFEDVKAEMEAER